MSVSIETIPAFHAGTPKQLFKGVYDLRSNSGVTYDVAPKNVRFLMIRPAEDTGTPTTVPFVLNWFEQLRRAVPVKGAHLLRISKPSIHLAISPQPTSHITPSPPSSCRAVT